MGKNTIEPQLSALIVIFFVISSAYAEHALNKPVANRMRATATTISKKMLVVLFSGFDTCEDQAFMSPLVKSLKQKQSRFRPQADLKYLRYCVEKDRTVRVKLPGKEQFEKNGMDFREAMLHLAKQQEGFDETVLIAHSWGGWAAMKAVEGMAKPTVENPYLSAPVEEGFEGPFNDGITLGFSLGMKDAKEAKEAKEGITSGDVQALLKKSKLKGEALEEYKEGLEVGYEDGKLEMSRAIQTPIVPPLKVSMLITIDPISAALPDGCNPGAAVLGRKGCKQFPADVNQVAVRQQVKHGWLNYYQTGSDRIHSGPAVEADNPVESQLTAGEHGSVKEDEYLQNQVVSGLLKIL